MIVIACTCLLISFFIFRHILRISKDGYLNIFYSIFYTLELLIAIILYLSDNKYRLYNGVMLSDSLPSFSCSIVVACIGVWFGQSMANHLLGIHKISINQRIESLNQKYRLNSVSTFFLIGFIFTILTSLNISYVIAAFALSFAFAPSFIGLIWNKLSKTQRYLWIIALSVNALFHAIQGSRGTALFPIIFVIIGYIISIRGNSKLFKKKLLVFGVISVISLPLLSFIAYFRQISGRGIEVNMENLELLWKVGQAYEVSSGGDDDAIKSSLGRTLIEANVAVPYMTPEKVDYRYDKYMLDEFFSIISLKGEEGSAETRLTRARAGFGTGVATNYGFPVTESTSVEFPLFADGYSRFGYFGLFIYSLIFAIILAGLEKWCSKLSRRHLLLSTILLLFILYNGLLSYMYSYYAFLKILIFRMSLVTAYTILVSIICKNNKTVNSK